MASLVIQGFSPPSGAYFTALSTSMDTSCRTAPSSPCKVSMGVMSRRRLRPLARAGPRKDWASSSTTSEKTISNGGDRGFPSSIREREIRSWVSRAAIRAAWAASAPAAAWAAVPAALRRTAPPAEPCPEQVFSHSQLPLPGGGSLRCLLPGSCV